MDKDRRFRIQRLIIERLHLQQQARGNAEPIGIVAIDPIAAPSIIPNQDPDQLPGHGRLGQGY